MKTIFITGANRGIGFELAKQYFKEGFRVLACTRDLNKANTLREFEKEDKDRMVILPLDVTDKNSIDQLNKLLSDERIDILVNNAGINTGEREFAEVDPATWLKVFSVNTIAPALIARSFYKQVKSSDLKIIANVSSSMGSITLNASGGYFVYRSSKVALNSVTKSLSIAYKEDGITVISLDPGWVKTDMGGANAMLTPEQSVNGIRKVLASINISDTGTFICQDGRRLPW